MTKGYDIEFSRNLSAGAVGLTVRASSRNSSFRDDEAQHSIKYVDYE
jgi:hypothetical protein